MNSKPLTRFLSEKFHTIGSTLRDRIMKIVDQPNRSYSTVVSNSAFASDFERMVHAGLEGPGERHKTTGPARKPVANWRYSTRWKKSCRIRISPHTVSSPDGIESNYDRAASPFRNIRRYPKTTSDYNSGEFWHNISIVRYYAFQKPLSV